MLKRCMRIGLICALALSIAGIAVAQQAPEPVVRMGGAIELADDLWVDFIGGGDFRFQFVHNRDFEGDIRDRPNSRGNQATSVHTGTADIWWAEAKFGFNMSYKKHLRAQMIMENQMTWDGNRIDNGTDLNGDSPTSQVFDDGRNLNCDDAAGVLTSGACLQRNTFNLERLWVDYQLQGTPLRFRIGADLWFHDQAGVIADDDPRVAIFAKFDNLELTAQVVLQNEGMRLGLTNDNDNIFYNFGVKYDLKPWRFALDATYFRFRFNQTQDSDTVLIMPSVSGSMGIFSGIIQPMFIFGSVDSNDPAQPNYDVAAFGAIGKIEVSLMNGRIKPFLAFVFGTGDDDPLDEDLDAFSPLPQREITLTTATSHFSVFTSASSWGARDVFPPAAVNMGTGFEFLHTVVNPWSDRPGNGLSPGISTTYNNPGVLLLAPGVKIDLTNGHKLDLYYIYRRVMESEPIEMELLNNEGVAVNVDESMTHELAASYSWTPSPYFDVRVFGAAVVPGAGVKDIASAQVCDNATGRRCDGDDVALSGEIRVRAKF